MKDRIDRIRRQALEQLDRIDDEQALEQLRVNVLGRSGELTSLLRGMKDLSPDQRKEVGRLANEAKDEIGAALDRAAQALKEKAEQRRGLLDAVDVTLPGRRRPRGSIHVLTQVLEQMVSIFEQLGFVWEDGPEVEEDFYNFTALNFPPDHPARDEQDTLFVSDPDVLLRTHTSPVQVRVMKRQDPPVRMISPGWVYRADAIDTTHYPMFSQVEGLLVDKHVTFGDLMGVLNEFVRRFFGPKIGTRFRSSFFPFTEPSAEVDIQCTFCGGTGKGEGGPCRVCRGSGFVELLGSGMVDPNVLKNVGYDPEIYTGFAFGVGVERVAMFRYSVDDIRLFFEGDLRFLKQF